MQTKEQLREELEHKKELIRAHIAYRMELEAKIKELEAENKMLKQKLMKINSTLQELIYWQP